MRKLYICLSLIMVGLDLSAQHFLVSPYLQIGHHPSPTSITLLWQTDIQDQNWVVEYQSAGTKNWTPQTGPTFTNIQIAQTVPHRIYTCLLTNLKPGEIGNYRVLKNGEVVFSSVIHTPKLANQPQKFVVFGDIGAGTKESVEIAKGVYEADADIAFVPGDIVYDNGLIREYQKRFWPIYNTTKVDTAGFPIMSKIPFVGAVGNHDADTRDLNRYPDALAYYYYWKQPLNGPIFQEGTSVLPNLIGTEENKKAFLSAAGESYPRMTQFSFEYGNAHWLILDADNYVDFTDKTLLDWIKEDLNKAQASEWRFVLFHHPGFNSSIEHFEQQQTRLLAPLFEAGKVDVVFTGHVHNYQRSYPLTFHPESKGIQLIGGRDGKTLRGKVVNGAWNLDKVFDGEKNTSPKGVIYIVTGAGGQDLYNPEQQEKPDSWQGFTSKFISQFHTFTTGEITGKKLVIRQLSATGKEVDRFEIKH